MGFRAPVVRDPAQDWRPYAMDILAGVLDGNESARLNKRLVREQQVASAVGAGYDSFSRGPGLFMLEATPSEGKTVVDVEIALRKEIELVTKEGVSEEELRRVKAQVMAGEVYKRDSLFYQAMQIGQIESIGLSHQDLPVMLKKLQAVTAAQVQAVARDILRDDQLTVAVLDPQPLAADKPQQGGNAHAH
jgi:zinc protease